MQPPKTPDELALELDYTLNTVGWICVGLLAVFCLEHFGRKREYPWLRISTYVRGVYNALAPWAWTFGVLIADALAFLQIIDVEDFAQTASEMIAPTLDIVTMFTVVFRACEARFNQCGTWEVASLGCISLFILTFLTIVTQFDFYMFIFDGVVVLLMAWMIYDKWDKPCGIDAPVEPPPEPEPEQPMRSPPARRRRDRGGGRRTVAE
jgi:hypothetical protein